MSQKKEAYFKYLLEYVQKKGGKFISPTYINSTTKHTFECSQGHRWDTVPSSITRGTWCAVCSGKSKNAARSDFEAIVKLNGGIILGQYIDTDTKILMQCSVGHQFEKTPHDVKYKGFCKRCNKKCPIDAEQNIKNIIESENANIIGKYINNRTDIQVQCLAGHILDVNPKSIQRYGFKCKICESLIYQNKFNEAVKFKNGKIISNYVNTVTKVTIECESGHKWEVKPHHVTSNRWCPICVDTNLEREARLFLESNKIVHSSQYKIPELSNRRFDFYFEYNGNKYLLEVDGKQHFKYVGLFHKSEDDLIKQQTIDRVKSLAAYHFGYRLIRIDYSKIVEMATHIQLAIQQDQPIYVSSPEKYKYLYSIVPGDIIIKYSENLAKKLGKDRIDKTPTLEDLLDRSDNNLLKFMEWLKRPEVRNAEDVRSLDKTHIF